MSRASLQDLPVELEVSGLVPQLHYNEGKRLRKLFNPEALPAATPADPVSAGLNEAKGEPLS